MKLRGDWLESGATQAVMAMLNDAGYQAFLVGGCVRNALLGTGVSDIDICSDATPEEVIQLAKNAGFKAIPTGIDHGTITVIAMGAAHEITTFRADVETDGRHAVVRFSKDIQEDAQRRDFTMNALYARADGTVVDPLSGLDDLRARRVRFIEDPARRIDEDVLRILRFFRFTAWYGNPALGMDPDALDAIARKASGLAKVSKERVTQELMKLLAAPDPTRALAAMQSTHVLTAILPGAEIRALGPLVHLENQAGLGAEPTLRLAALGAIQLEDLRLSKAQAQQVAALRQAAISTDPAAVLGYRHGHPLALQSLVLRAALLEQPLAADAAAQCARGNAAKFPIRARDLMPGRTGPALGAALKHLEEAWIASDFTLTKAQLLAQLD